MRHSQRHLPYAVSTVLGLAAPALAALLLTSSTPGLAAVAPVASAPVEVETRLHPHAPVVAPAVKPVVKHVAPAPKKVVAAVQHVAVTPVVRRTAAKPVVRATTRTVSQTKQPWGVDDYPYRNQSDFYATDKWGFTQRQCVSFAAWRWAQHGKTINNSANWGSAYSWDEAARRLGHTVTKTARVGAIAQWNAGEGSAYYAPGSATANGHFTAGGYGHVGYVKMVYSDGSALVEQYNMGNSRRYSVMRVKAPRYLVF